VSILNPFANKTILLGVTGSIAAYKAADLASKLTQAGAKVEVILTPAALHFIAPLTFQSVTGRKAFTDADLWGGEGHVTHISLGQTGDLYILAPISANSMAKLAHGIADNLAVIAALAARCPLLLAPAMDAGMFSHPATEANVEILRSRGIEFVGPEEGHMASGLVGLGRMSEPVDILNRARLMLARGGPLAGRKVVVTAGGTQEAIDPVRVITNRSSGKQGIAIARAALDAGADVTLITGTVSTDIPAGTEHIQAFSAADMAAAVHAAVPGADALIMAAAVADFRPAHAASQKIKKDGTSRQIELEPTVDILASLVTLPDAKRPRKVIGFAAESQNLLDNARVKLAAKKLDMIVANDISARDAGFGVETNRVTFLYSDSRQEPLSLRSKDEVAAEVIQRLIEMLAKHQPVLAENPTP
jgi:phosphopantothenoylcysteine decarboxylase/phosphopantothenate--cysteine ligase